MTTAQMLMELRQAAKGLATAEVDAKQAAAKIETTFNPNAERLAYNNGYLLGRIETVSWHIARVVEALEKEKTSTDCDSVKVS